MDTRYNEGDVFKKRFKYYKSNKLPASLDDVLKISQTPQNFINTNMVQLKDGDTAKDDRVKYLGLLDKTNWKIYTFIDKPGLILIQNPFTAYGQRFWIRNCLENYTVKPNRTNIDYEVKLEDWWRECYKNDECNRILQKKMRWTTLGYHHNWDTKVYHENNKDKFPEDLAELCDVVAIALGFNAFKPQAAIVNYYHMDSTLSPHTDHSEVNLEAPLFSFSFGQSAIFLIGGREKDVEPLAIMLYSGDILVMSKETRLCYHAVPKILPASYKPWNKMELSLPDDIPTNFKYISNAEKIMFDMKRNKECLEWIRFNDYIKQSRININVRQVLKESQSCLSY